MNDFLNRSPHSSPLQKVISNGITHDSPDTVADEFSNYFFEIFSQEHSTSHCNLIRSDQSFFLFPVTPADVLTAIVNLKEASPGIDQISARHLKLVVGVICEPLSVIINLAFKNGIFPNSLKVAKVIIPVYKKGDRLSVSNYRLICILSSLSKVIEKLFIIRLSKYLQKIHLLNPCQFGFREVSSTNLALLSLTDYIKRSIDSGCVVGSVSFFLLYISV